MCTSCEENMNQEQIMKLAIPAAILFAAWKYGGTAVKTGALGIAAVVVAKQVPYLNQVV